MRRTSAPLLVLALAAALSACTEQAAVPVAGPAPSVTYQAGDVPVLVPGAPGEDATVIPPGGTGTRANADAYTADDVAFMTDMVSHHAQALEMAELAPERASDARVKTLAGRIAAAQGPEIDVMQAWLEQHGLPRADPATGHGAGHGGGHGGEAMPGMAGPEDMTRLVASRGTAFDRLFLDLMSRHHQGALEMAAQAADAQHPVVTELITDVAVTQGVEIERMQEVLADLPS